MCDRSNRPARCRTARCSSRIPLYWTGMSQPAKSMSRAPRARWRSTSGVTLTESSTTSAMLSRPIQTVPTLHVATSRSATRWAARSTQAALGLERQDAAGLGELEPANLVELVVVIGQVAAGRPHEVIEHGLVDARAALGEGVADRVDAARRYSTSSPVSSATSRRAVCSVDSPGWGVPFGRVQVWISLRRPATNRGIPASNRTTTPPAEVAVACFRRATAPTRRSIGSRAPGRSDATSASTPRDADSTALGASGPGRLDRSPARPESEQRSEVGSAQHGRPGGDGPERGSGPQPESLLARSRRGAHEARRRASRVFGGDRMLHVRNPTVSGSVCKGGPEAFGNVRCQRATLLGQPDLPLGSRTIQR